MQHKIYGHHWLGTSPIVPSGFTLLPCHTWWSAHGHWHIPTLCHSGWFKCKHLCVFHCYIHLQFLIIQKVLIKIILECSIFHTEDIILYRGSINWEFILWIMTRPENVNIPCCRTSAVTAQGHFNVITFLFTCQSCHWTMIIEQCSQIHHSVRPDI